MADFMMDPLRTTEGIQIGGGLGQEAAGFGLDPEIHGRGGAPDFFGTMMGREGGGGWVSEPLPHGAEHSRGVVAQAPAGDPDRNHSDLTGVDPVRGANPSFMGVVDGWAGSSSAEGGWKG